MVKCISSEDYFRIFKDCEVFLSVYVSQWNSYYTDSYLNKFVKIIFADFFCFYFPSPVLSTSLESTDKHFIFLSVSLDLPFTFMLYKVLPSLGGIAYPEPSQMFANLLPSSFIPLRDEIKNHPGSSLLLVDLLLE